MNKAIFKIPAFIQVLFEAQPGVLAIKNIKVDIVHACSLPT